MDRIGAAKRETKPDQGIALWTEVPSGPNYVRNKSYSRYLSSERDPLR